eukprot:m.265928 g.265928  ORF g.265928 m.265928 type:complete len:108 (+) comp26762_c1_seq7:163-486(+)
MVTLHASHTLAMIQQLRIIWSQYVGYSESYVQSGMRETVTITTGSPACEVRCCATDPSINVRIEPYPRVPTTSIAAPACLWWVDRPVCGVVVVVWWWWYVCVCVYAV